MSEKTPRQIASLIACTLWFAGVSAEQAGDMSADTLADYLANSGLTNDEIATGMQEIGDIFTRHAESLSKHLAARKASRKAKFRVVSQS